MITIPISEAEIICTIGSLKNKNCTVYGGISNKIQNVCGVYFGKRLAHVFNESFTPAHFPDCLKYSVVNPFFKRSENFQMPNYRPTSLLVGFSIFEILIFHR